MKGFLTSTKIIYGGIFAGVALFAVVVYFLLKPSGEPPTPPFLIFVLPLLIALGLLFAEIFPARKLQNVRGKDLKTKLATYQNAVLIKAMALETPAMIAILIALILQNRYWLWFSVFPIIWMLYRFPTKSDFIKNLNLTYDELQKLKAEEDFK